MVAPVYIACMQAVMIDCTSNVIAQSLTCWAHSEPWHIDPILWLQFAICACCMAPLNYTWQSFLERMFPMWKKEPLSKSTRGRSVSNRTEAIALEERQELVGQESTDAIEKSEEESVDEDVEPGRGFVKRKSKRNILLKMITDCVTIGPLWYVTAFLIIMGVVKLKSFDEIITTIREEELTIIYNSYKFWPFVGIINFTFVPMEKRIVFFSVCGLLWNIYMSFVAARL